MLEIMVVRWKYNDLSQNVGNLNSNWCTILGTHLQVYGLEGCGCYWALSWVQSWVQSLAGTGVFAESSAVNTNILTVLFPPTAPPSCPINQSASTPTHLTHSCCQPTQNQNYFAEIFMCQAFWVKYLIKKCCYEPNPQLSLKYFVDFCKILKLLS